MSRNDMWFKRSDSASNKSGRFICYLYEHQSHCKHTLTRKHTHIFLLSRSCCALRMLWGALFRVAISKAAVSASPPPSSSYVIMFSLISSSSTGDWVSRFCLRNDSESAATTIQQKRARENYMKLMPLFMNRIQNGQCLVFQLIISEKRCLTFRHWVVTLILTLLHWHSMCLTQSISLARLILY